MIIRTGLFLDNEKRPYNEMLTVLDTEPRHGASSEGPPPCRLAAWRRCTFLNGMEEEAPHPCRSSSMPPGGMEEASSVHQEEDGMEEASSSSSSSSAPSTSMDTVMT